MQADRPAQQLKHACKHKQLLFAGHWFVHFQPGHNVVVLAARSQLSHRFLIAQPVDALHLAVDQRLVKHRVHLVEIVCQVSQLQVGQSGRLDAFQQAENNGGAVAKVAVFFLVGVAQRFQHLLLERGHVY